MACYDFKKGICREGDSCKFSHGARAKGDPSRSRKGGDRAVGGSCSGVRENEGYRQGGSYQRGSLRRDRGGLGTLRGGDQDRASRGGIGGNSIRGGYGGSHGDERASGSRGYSTPTAYSRPSRSSGVGLNSVPPKSSAKPLTFQGDFGEILLKNEWVKVEIIERDVATGGGCSVQRLHGFGQRFLVNIGDLSPLGSHDPESEVNIWKRKEYNILKDLLEKEGWSIDDIAEDGNCLFRAAARHLFGDQEMFPKVRKETVEYVRANKSYFMQYGYNINSINKRLEEQMKNSSWGGNLEIAAISKRYNVGIILWELSEKGELITPINEPQVSSSREVQNIYLVRHRRAHYNCVFRKKGNLRGARERLQVGKEYKVIMGQGKKCVREADGTVRVPEVSDQSLTILQQSLGIAMSSNRPDGTLLDDVNGGTIRLTTRQKLEADEEGEHYIHSQDSRVIGPEGHYLRRARETLQLGKTSKVIMGQGKNCVHEADGTVRVPDGEFLRDTSVEIMKLEDRLVFEKDGKACIHKSDGNASGLDGILADGSIVESLNETEILLSMREGTPSSSSSEWWEYLSCDSDEEIDNDRYLYITTEIANDKVFRLRLLDAIEYSTFYRNLVLSDTSLIEKNTPLSRNNVIRHKIPDSRSLENIAFFINNPLQATATMSWIFDVNDVLLLLFWAERLCVDKLRLLCLSTLKKFIKDKGSHAFALVANREESNCCGTHSKKLFFSVNLHCHWNMFGEMQNTSVLKLTILSKGRFFCEKCMKWCWKNLERPNCEYVEKSNLQARIGSKDMILRWNYSNVDYIYTRGPLLECVEVLYDLPLNLTTTTRHQRNHNGGQVGNDSTQVLGVSGKLSCQILASHGV